MDSEILKTLQEIRGFFFVLLVLFGIWVASTVLAKAIYVYRSFREEWGEEFSRRAERLASENKLDLLKEHCKAKLLKQPNHLSALLWLGKAEYRSGHQEEALPYFEKVIRLAPHWEEDCQPYIERINETSTANK